jgi:hypothetical protein
MGMATRQLAYSEHSCLLLRWFPVSNAPEDTRAFLTFLLLDGAQALPCPECRS